MDRVNKMGTLVNFHKSSCKGHQILIVGGIFDTKVNKIEYCAGPLIST